MEAFSVVSNFASIIGLLMSFYSMNDNSEPDINDFYNWLYTSNHKNTLEIIQNDKELKAQIEYLINNNHNEILSKLSNLNDLLIVIASQVDGLSGLANKFSLKDGLSEQAVDVLKQFANSGSKSMHRFETIDGAINYALDDNISIKYSEKRFIDDDVQALVDNKLIMKRTTPDGYTYYDITRQAISFLKQLNK